MKVTKEQISMNFKGHDIIIPKGTRITNHTACGIDEKYNFVSDLSFINKKEQYPLWHDAYYYGIDIDASLLETI